MEIRAAEPGIKGGRGLEIRPKGSKELSEAVCAEGPSFKGYRPVELMH